MFLLSKFNQVPILKNQNLISKHFNGLLILYKKDFIDTFALKKNLKMPHCQFKYFEMWSIVHLSKQLQMIFTLAIRYVINQMVLSCHWGSKY